MGLSIFEGPIARRMASALTTMAENQSAGIGAAEEKAETAKTTAQAASAKVDQLETSINNLTATNLKAVGYEAQNLTDNQKSQARTNIGAASAADLTTATGRITTVENALQNIDELTTGNIKYDQDQTTGANALSAEQQATARKNIGLENIGSLVSGAVKYDEAQDITTLQKAQARDNIGAAAAGDMSVISSDLNALKSKVNNADASVTHIEKVEGGIQVTYSDDYSESLTIEAGGLAFDSGYVDKDNYLHLTMKGEDLDSSVFTPFQLPATGGSGTATTVISISNAVKPTYVRNNNPAVFSFTATSTNETDTITVVWSVNGNVISTASNDSGSTFTFDAGEYLTESSQNTVKAELTSTSEGHLTRNYPITTYAYALTWGAAISPVMLVTNETNIFAVVNVSAEAGSSNDVTLTVGEHTVTRTVNGSRNITVELNSSWFTTGSNRITAVMAPTGSSNVEDRSDEISFVVLWAVNATAPIVAFANQTMEIAQYDVASINYFVYDPSNETATCTIQVGSEDPVTVQVGRTAQTFEYSSPIIHTSQVVLTCGAQSDTMTLNVVKSDYEIGKVTGDNLRYDVDPVGHSNSDSDRESFGGFTFSENFDWVNGGFQRDENGTTAFVVKKGNQVTLPRSLFEEADANGKTIDLSFKITNSDAYNAVAMRDMDNGGTKGIILRANEGEIRLNNQTGQIFRYCEESRIDLSILVEAECEQRVATVWLHGLPSKVNPYDAGLLVQNESNMVIGSTECDVWIYAIRVYNSELDKFDMIQNYIASGKTTTEKVDRCKVNNVYDSVLRKITPAKLHQAMPDLTIVEISAERMTKNKKDPVAADVSITDGAMVLTLSKASANNAKDGCVFKVQGTSSVAYARSALNMDIDFSKCGKTYKISENSIPVKYLNIKVNVASSENANNVCAVDWYNTYQPFKIEARKNNPSIRDTVEGKPCAVFFTNSGSQGVWVSSQYVAPGETILYVMGDLCNSKKNTEVFGEENEGEHPTMCCIECSGNDTDEQKFHANITFNEDNDEWDTYKGIDEKTGEPVYVKHFEWRMEPSSANRQTCITAWTETVAWVVSTIGDPAKFKEELNQYFTTDSLLYHFLMIEYFAGYDNVCKNTFFSFDWDSSADQTKWGGYRWNIKNAYDWDTILAHDNDGYPLGDYGVDYGDTTNGRWYFNAENPIWTNIQAAFQSELSAMYISLRGLGAWNSNAIIAKWDAYQARRPHAAMVEDMYNKYILPYKTKNVILDTDELGYDSSYLSRLAGSKTYQRRQYLTYQTNYMDGKYGYYDQNSAIQFRVNGAEETKTFTAKAYAKTYLKFIKDGQLIASRKVGTGGVATFENIEVGNNTTMYVTPESLVQYIRPLNETANSTFGAGGAMKLLEVVLGGESVNSAWDSSRGITIPSPILKEMNIRNVANFSSNLNLKANTELKTLDTRGTNAGVINLPDYAPLQTIRLNANSAIEALNLKNVETFTMESGANLVSVRAENCNDVFLNSLATYLTDAVNAGGNTTKRIRAINVGWDDENGHHGWSFDNTNVLYNIAKSWKGYNANGETQNAPVVTGVVHVTSLSTKKLETIEATFGEGELDTENKVWTGPSLTITYDNIVPYYTVSFINIDGSAIKDKNGNDYVQYVDYGESAYDPVDTEVNTPVYTDPVGQYYYTWTGWTNLSGAVYQDKTVIAAYTQTEITYTVQWFTKLNGTLLHKIENVTYGSEVVYPNGIPTLSDEEEASVYKVFAGWDKSTGFITKDTNVYAQWTTAALPAVGKKLNEMNVAEISGIAKNDQAADYWDPEDDDYVDIVVGRDFNFDTANVASEVLASELYLDGRTATKTNVKLFDETAPNFTLAIDFEFLGTTEGAVIACCTEFGGTEGFSLRMSNYKPNILWGDTNTDVGYGMQRGIVVLRHRAGSKNLQIYADNTGAASGIYSAAILETEKPRSVATSTDATLAFGGIPYGNNAQSRATGVIHWAKIWYQDLGAANCRQLASWPHETWRMKYVGPHLYAQESGEDCAATFIADAALNCDYVLNANGRTSGGWATSSMRDLTNNRVFNALPIGWQAILKNSIVKALPTSSSSTAGISLAKVCIPAVAEVMPVSAGSYNLEGSTFSTYLYNQDRVKFKGLNRKTDEQIIENQYDPTSLSGYTVREGDIWARLTGQSSELPTYYMYVSEVTAANHGIIAGKTKDSLVAANGSQGGYWVEACTYWTRSVSIEQSGEYYFFSISSNGRSNSWSAASTTQATTIMFSI